MRAAPEWFDLPMRALEYLLIRVLPIAAPFLPLVLLGPVPVSVRDLPLIAVGYVRDSITMEPIQGARVFADADPIRFETRTDERGRFELKLPALGSGREPPDAFENGYSVLAEADGYRSTQVSKVEGLPSRYPVSLPLYLLEAVAALVTVGAIDADGRESAFDRIRFRQGAASGWTAPPSEPYRAPAGFVKVEVRCDDGRWGEVTAFVPPGPCRQIALTVPLIAGRRVTGVVVDQHGNPVPGATVRAIAAENPAWRAVAPGEDCDATQTAAAGSFSLSVPPGASSEIEARHPRYFAEGGRDRAGLDPPAGIRLELRSLQDGTDAGGGASWSYLTGAEALSGIVRDARTGEPLVDVAVTPLRVLTDRFGKWVAEEVRDWGQLVFRKDGYASGYGWGEPANVRDVTLRPKAVLRMRLRDEDGPVRDSLVSVSTAEGSASECWTDPGGRARVVVEPGRWSQDAECRIVTVRKPNGWEHYAPVPHSSMPRRLLESVGLLTPGPVAGRRFEWGDQVALGTIRLDSATSWILVPFVSNRWEYQVEDPEGRPIPYPFAIECPPGRILSHGDSEGRLPYVDPMFRIRGCMTVLSAPGQESLLLRTPGTVRLGPDAPITGRMIDGDGKPAAGVVVFAGDSVDLATATVPPRYRSLPAVTDTLGRFTLRGIPEGRQVFVYRPIPNEDDPKQLGETTGGAADIEIRLPD